MQRRRSLAPPRMLEVVEEDHEFDLAGSARVDVLVSAIEPKQASQIVKELSALLPLDQAQLTHLKRIRSSHHPGTGRMLQALLAPSDVYQALEESKRKELEERFSLSPILHAVPRLEPRTREQFVSGQSAWPMIFHHSTSEEARRAARVIPVQDTLEAVNFMRNALADAEAGRRQAGGRATVGAVLVDPAVGKVVASASRERQHVHDEGPPSMHNHPLHHAAMLCVSGVSRALLAGQNEGVREGHLAGGKQNEGVREGHLAGGKLPPEGEGEKATGSDVTADIGVAADLGGISSDTPCDSDVGVEVLSPKQYLCTGFDLYITREPCLMCAMALVHSRVRRVIYGARNPEHGCLGSLMMLHSMPALNHNYRVFEGVCADECQLSLRDEGREPAAESSSGLTAGL